MSSHHHSPYEFLEDGLTPANLPAAEQIDLVHPGSSGLRQLATYLTGVQCSRFCAWCGQEFCHGGKFCTPGCEAAAARPRAYFETSA
jgi:hypothetical protein